ncbi:MAG TPA: DUF2608 domain-containing protein [Rickettsia endosymbiont of Sericostoma sp.]|jgi:Protein of unknown function (DUF2608)|uniref:DUF2608 domain-containing protein n=2 Tax=Candidatus Tisiphia TaxID=2996317 RepID=UPI001DC45C1F|nr:DUF2608 domain-containing protein [Rickettsia endosymbiont of Sericostoma sp.]
MTIKNNFLLKLLDLLHKSKLLLILVMLPYTSYAIIIPTYSIDSVTVKNLFEKIDGSSLVLINIDDTIVTPKSNMFRYANPYGGFTQELAALKKYRSNIDEVIAKLLLQRQVMLVEANWSKFIDKLKSSGALVFGFTKINPACRRIENYEEWQYEQLSRLGIKFTDKVNNKEILKFDENDKRSPIFYKGIIFTDFLNKSQALYEFMRITNILPNNIIIFENKKSELNDIDNFLKTVDLNYYGIEYLAATELKGIPQDNIVKVQQEILLKTGKWLEDDEAKQFIENNK